MALSEIVTPSKSRKKVSVAKPKKKKSFVDASTVSVVESENCSERNLWPSEARRS